jgi:thiamine transport system permease protein
MAPPAFGRVSRYMLLVAPLAFLALFFAFPLARTLGAAADADAWQWAAGPFVRRHLAVAFAQAAATVVVVFAIALPLAWFHHRRRIAGTRAALAVHAAPFVLPVFVVVDGIRGVVGTGGWTDTWFGLDALAAIGPFWTVVVAHTYYNYGFATRLLHDALARRPHALEEAAALVGAGPGARLAHVLAPLLAPQAAAVALLVFLFAFTSFGVVLLMGQGDVATLETLLWQNLQGVIPRHGRAAVLGVVQLAVNIAVVLAYLLLIRRNALPRHSRRAVPAGRRRDRVLLATFLAVGLAPVVAVLVGGFRVGGDWTLEAWRAILDPAHPAHFAGFALVPVLARSVGYALGAIVVAVALAVALAYGLRAAGRLRRVAETFAALPLGTSSVLLGFGFLLAFGAGSVLDLRGQAWMIVVVHALVAFPFVARILLSAFDQHDHRYDEAAALVGAAPLAIARRVHLPLLRGPLAGAAGLAAAFSLGDFGASLILMRTDTMSLAVWIGRFDAPYRLLLHAQGVALTTVLMALAAGAMFIAHRFGADLGGERT